MRDLIVEETRRIRQEHAKKFNFDLDAIFENLKQKERNSRRNVVTRQPRPPKPVGARK